ncbi:MAG: hypothetical protein KA223_02510 [Candidatus Accumulibacter sp.]|nr:hypothetical protein [Accumulibacter sp.]
MTDEQIDAIFNAMPGGPAGFCKEWGPRQFARELLEACGHDPEMERLRSALYAATQRHLPPTTCQGSISSCGCWTMGPVGGPLQEYKCNVHNALSGQPPSGTPGG